VWDLEIPQSINAKFFGKRDDSPQAGTFRRPIHEWQKGRRLIEYLEAHDVRAVIMQGYRYISYLRTISYCDRVGIPLFVNNDSNILSDRHMSSVKRWAKTQVYGWWIRRTTGVMSMGELGDQFFIRYGADPKKLYRLPCTPDYDFYAAVDAGRLQRFHHKFGLSAKRKYLLYSGRLVPQKRVDLIIDAFASIATERPEWDLLIVGDGVQGDELHRRVPESIRPRVVWTGFLDRDEPALAYHAADVLVLPSDHEPWALVVQEAMAAGLVVVSSHVSGAAHELIDDGVSGRIFTAGNRHELEIALRQVTAADALQGYQERSRAALAEWRNRVDPVAEVRRALRDCGVLCD
jgi:glycosyltransferase involved in cell wall biosynthesis